MQLIRGSELSDFLRCRLRWKMAWIDNLESKRPNNKLFFGTLFHKFLELYYRYGDVQVAHVKMLDFFNESDTSGMDEVEAQEIWQMAETIAKNYYQTYKTDFNNWEVIATELTFAIPLDDEIGYTGTIDLIVRDKKDGRIYFLDHKTTQSIDKYDKNSDLDRQISRYWWALQQLAKGNGHIFHNEMWYPVRQHAVHKDLMRREPSGFIYNIILKDYPAPPKVLKDGSLSKAKNQNTTYELYVKELYEKGFGDDVYENGEHVGWSADEEYKEILAHLRDYPKEYFRRIEVRRNQAEIDNSIAEFYNAAIDIDMIRMFVNRKESSRHIYRNITADCHWDCQFKEICQASMDGSNVDFLRESLYKEKDNSGTPTL